MTSQPIIINEGEMPPSLDSDIRESLCRCFPADVSFFSKSRAWHGSEPAWSVVIMNEAIPIAHLGAVERFITVGEDVLHVVGIQNVYVLPEHRKEGLSDKLLQAGMEWAMTKGYDCGLLFCVPKLEIVYGRNGWINLGEDRAREAVRLDETGEASIPGKNIVMYYPLRREVFPEGRIHLRGNDW